MIKILQCEGEKKNMFSKFIFLQSLLFMKAFQLEKFLIASFMNI